MCKISKGGISKSEISNSEISKDKIPNGEMSKGKILKDDIWKGEISNCEIFVKICFMLRFNLCLKKSKINTLLFGYFILFFGKT